MAKLKKLKIAVIGATGYTGLDLVYFLSKHLYIKKCADFISQTIDDFSSCCEYQKRLI